MLSPHEAEELMRKLKYRCERFKEREQIAAISDSDCEVCVGGEGDDEKDERFVTSWSEVQDVMLRYIDDDLECLDKELSEYGIRIE